MLAHDLLQEGQTVHAGHLDIERDYVRHLFADPLGGDERIAGGADHLDSRIRGQDLAQRAAHHRGIVDDEDANFRGAHAVASLASSRYTSTSPVPVWK